MFRVWCLGFRFQVLGLGCAVGMKSFPGAQRCGLVLWRSSAFGQRESARKRLLAVFVCQVILVCDAPRILQVSEVAGPGKGVRRRRFVDQGL